MFWLNTSLCRFVHFKRKYIPRSEATKNTCAFRYLLSQSIDSIGWCVSSQASDALMHGSDSSATHLCNSSRETLLERIIYPFVMTLRQKYIHTKQWRPTRRLTMRSGGSRISGRKYLCMSRTLCWQCGTSAYIFPARQENSSRKTNSKFNQFEPAWLSSQPKTPSDTVPFRFTELSPTGYCLFLHRGTIESVGFKKLCPSKFPLAGWLIREIASTFQKRTHVDHLMSFFIVVSFFGDDRHHRRRSLCVISTSTLLDVSIEWGNKQYQSNVLTC